MFDDDDDGNEREYRRALELRERINDPAPPSSPSLLEQLRQNGLVPRDTPVPSVEDRIAEGIFERMQRSERRGRSSGMYTLPFRGEDIEESPLETGGAGIGVGGALLIIGIGWFLASYASESKR